MRWASENWRIVAAIVAGVIWAAQKFGPSIWQQTRKAFAAIRPRIGQMSTLLSAWPLIVAAILLWPLLMPTPAVVPITPPRPPDIVDISAAAHRALVADAVADYGNQSFSDVKAAEDWINEKLLDCYEAAYDPLHLRIAKTKQTGRFTEFAEQIRKGELHE